MNYISQYLQTVSDLVAKVPEERVQKVVDTLMEAYENGRHIFVIGNGGSAATASHLAGDLQKSLTGLGDKPFKAMALTDSLPIILAWANDSDYSNIFAAQLEAWLNPGDVVLAFSGSGNSPNIIKALEKADSMGANTVGFSGYNGGKLGCTAHD
ncbi:MAG: SIS domain-containing protein, partial [Patescibacteria group bacterium]|nr:SIS domain-containing protein [Patescibacteria group bacterium]